MVKTKRKRKALRVCHPDAAGIDIGANEHWVAVSADCDDSPVRPFGTFTSDLQRLADWLATCGVRTVAMESTGVYWIPLYELLEERGFEVLLVNAAHARNVPAARVTCSTANGSKNSTPLASCGRAFDQKPRLQNFELIRAIDKRSSKKQPDKSNACRSRSTR